MGSPKTKRPSYHSRGVTHELQKNRYSDAHQQAAIPMERIIQLLECLVTLALNMLIMPFIIEQRLPFMSIDDAAIRQNDNHSLYLY